MGVLETFSKRAKRMANAGLPDVFQYAELPPPFRVQVVHIWISTIGSYYNDSYGFQQPSPANQFWDGIFQAIRRERGVFSLSSDSFSDAQKQCIDHLLSAETSDALDIIELSFRVIDRAVRRFGLSSLHRARATQDADDAIEELNDRFREHGIGYQYVDGVLIRLDSQFIHSEAVKPALALLHEEGFDGPADEFIQAFDHHKRGKNKEAMDGASKAFESTMKAICKARHWTHPPNATAIPLLKILFDKGLIPQEMESHFAALRAAMESGLPTIANKHSRHGQGPEPKTVPTHFGTYALHLAAANIVFLVQAHRSLP